MNLKRIVLMALVLGTVFGESALAAKEQRTIKAICPPREVMAVTYKADTPYSNGALEKRLVPVINELYSHNTVGAKLKLREMLKKDVQNAPLYYYWLSYCFNLEGNKSLAIETINKALAIDPKYADGYFFRATLKGDNSAKYGDFNKWIEYSSGDKKYNAYKYVAMTYSQEGKMGKALALLSKAQKEMPQLVEDSFYWSKADVYFKGNEYQKAIDVLKTAPTHNEVQTLRDLAYIYEFLGENEACEETIKAARKLSPKGLTLIPDLARVYIRQGKYEEALGELDKAVVKGPDYYAVKSEICYRLGRYEDGIDTIKNNTWYGDKSWGEQFDAKLALNEYGLGKYEEALKLIEGELAFEPKYPNAKFGEIYKAGNLDVKGMTLIALGKPKEALATLEEALKVYTFNPMVYTNMGDAYAKLGKKAAAKECYSKAINMNSDLYASQKAKRGLLSI